MRRITTLALAIGLLASPALGFNGARAAAGPCQPPRCISGSLTVGSEQWPFDVLLPAGYDTSDTRYPVVYLLSGGLDDQDTWIKHEHVDVFTSTLPASQQAIVVLPSPVAIGQWIDWQNGNHLYETGLAKMLIPYIDAHYRTIADRGHRAIAGLSFGGFGALFHAARRPDMFAAVGSFSGVDDVTDPVIEAAVPPVVAGVSALCLAEQAGAPNPTPENPQCASNVGLKDVLPPSGWGNPVTGQAFFHAHNPGDLAINYRGMPVWLASGNGMPCNQSEVNPGGAGAGAEEAVLIRRTHVEFDAHLTAAGIPRTSIYRPCGLHDADYFSADLAQWWPVMMQALGKPDPRTFDYRGMDRTFSVWGWTISADPARAVEFLTVEGASTAGVGLTGSGLTTVTTGPLFAPGKIVGLQGATTTSATADHAGRLTFQVDLGAPHQFDEYTAQAITAEKAAGITSTGYFTSREVRFVNSCPNSGGQSQSGVASSPAQPGQICQTS